MEKIAFINKRKIIHIVLSLTHSYIHTPLFCCTLLCFRHFLFFFYFFVESFFTSTFLLVSLCLHFVCVQMNANWLRITVALISLATLIFLSSLSYTHSHP